MPHEEVSSSGWASNQHAYANGYASNYGYSNYGYQCGQGQSCQVGLVCYSGSCLPQGQTGTTVYSPQQVTVLRNQLQTRYVATQNYIPTTAAAERAREYELAQQASLLQQIQTNQYGSVDYSYVQGKLAEIEQEKRRIELEFQKRTVEQQAVKQEYLNDVRIEQNEIANQVNTLQRQQGNLNRLEGVVDSRYVTGYGNVNQNPNDYFYDRLRSQVNVQAGNTYLATDHDNVDEVAGLPVAGFVGLMIGIVLCVLISLCLLRYICFPRGKYQNPEDQMEMGSQGPQSPNIQHQDIYGSNTSMNMDAQKQNQGM